MFYYCFWVDSKNPFGIYAVATMQSPAISTTTRCCPAMRATFPVTPSNSPSITLTVSPLLNLHCSDETMRTCSLSVLVAIVQHDLQLKRLTYEVLQILSISLMDKIPLVDLFERTDSLSWEVNIDFAGFDHDSVEFLM